MHELLGKSRFSLMRAIASCESPINFRFFRISIFLPKPLPPALTFLDQGYAEISIVGLNTLNSISAIFKPTSMFRRVVKLQPIYYPFSLLLVQKLHRVKMDCGY